jgi:hypothetical protein
MGSEGQSATAVTHCEDSVRQSRIFNVTMKYYAGRRKGDPQTRYRRGAVGVVGLSLIK